MPAMTMKGESMGKKRLVAVVLLALLITISVAGVAAAGKVAGWPGGSRVTTVVAGTSATISWPSLTSAVGYRWYLSGAATASGDANEPATNFANLPAGRYTFKIYAVNMSDALFDVLRTSFTVQ